MADALDHIEKLAAAHKYLTGAKDVLDNAIKVYTVSKSNPKDVEALEKVLGIAEDKYKPLKTYLTKTQQAVLAAEKSNFPDIPNPIGDAKAKMEKIAKAKGPNTPGFEKELNAYIKQLVKYEAELKERLSYMGLLKTKCDLNIKNFERMGQVIGGTMTALKAVFVSIPEAQTTAGTEILNIMKAGIEKQPQAIANAYKRLKKKVEAHEKVIAREHVYAKAAMKAAADKKLVLLMEDAKAFFNKLF